MTDRDLLDSGVNPREPPEQPNGEVAATLSPAYLAAVRAVEHLPSNQDGVDKSWVWRAMEASRLHFARANRV